MNRSSHVLLTLALCFGFAVVAVPAAALGFGPVSSFGSFGAGAGQLNDPGDVVLAPDGTAYVSDFENSRIDVFSSTGGFEFAFGKEVEPGPGKGGVCTPATGCQAGVGNTTAGALSAPEGVGISSDGKVYIADTGSNRIQVYTLQGEFLFSFGKAVDPNPAAANRDVCTAASGCQVSTADGSAGSFGSPRGLAIGPEGNVYVADRDDNRIDVFSAAGTFIRAIGAAVNVQDGSGICTASSGCKVGAKGPGAGEMERPSDVKFGPGDQMVVADRGHLRIEVFSAAGAFQHAFGKGVNPNDQSGVCSVACQAGEAGASADAFVPNALDVDGDGNVYVADATNDRVSQLTIAGQLVRVFGEGVLNGAEAFQVCLPGDACQAGLEGPNPGSTLNTLGLAAECHGGGLYVTVRLRELDSVKRFGEAVAAPGPLKPCEVGAPAGPGPPPPPGTTERPSNKFALGRLKLDRRRGVATLAATVPGPGALAL